MFKSNFIRLCNARGIAPTVACRAIGLTAATFTKWDENSVPRRATLQKFADYFGVTVDELVGTSDETAEQTEKAPEEPKLSEGEAMLLEAIRDVPEDQRPALLVELMRIALKNQK